jgi:hypothetical protein
MNAHDELWRLINHRHSLDWQLAGTFKKQHCSLGAK